MTDLQATAMPLSLVFGNSHIWPYARGHRLASAKGRNGWSDHIMEFHGDRYDPYIARSDKGMVYHPSVAEDIRAAIAEFKPVCLITAVQGSDHWRLAASNDIRPYDFIVPALPQHPLSPGTEFIPYDLLLRRFRSDLDWLFGLVRDVQTFSNLPMFHIEAPPPVGRADLMFQGRERALRERIGQLGCPSVSFRYKMWWIWTHITKAFCQDLGLHFIEGPAETRDPNGLLNERYYLDGIHGTDEYGELIARELARKMHVLGIAGGRC